MKTIACILVEQGKPVVVDEVEMPSLAFGQVLVRIKATGICGKQLDEHIGTRGHDPYLPHLMGHEAAGVVEGVGEGVTRVKIGDHVVASWMKGSGINAPTPTYLWNGKKINAGNITTFQRHSIISENRLSSIPHDIPFDDAALLGCAIPTGMGIVINQAKAGPGDTLAVFGAGGIGLSAINAASLVSAGMIIAIDMVEEKLQMAKRFGATHVINAQKTDPVEAIKQLTKGAGVDFSICTIGKAKPMEQAYDSAHQSKGSVILAAVPGEKICLDPYPMNSGRKISGSHGGDTVIDRDIPKYVSLYQAGKIKTKDLISNRFKIEEINNIFESLKKGEISGRAIIEF